MDSGDPNIIDKVFSQLLGPRDYQSEKDFNIGKSDGERDRAR